MVVSRRIILRMRNVPDKFVEKIKTHILCSLTFFSENLAGNGKMLEKYGRAGQATNVNIIRRRKDVICVLDTSDRNTEPYSISTYC